MTGLIDILKEALAYPTKDFKALVIFGVIFLLANLTSVAVAWKIQVNTTLIGIFALITFIIYFITLGYLLSVLKETINFDDSIPALNIAQNFTDGIKVFIIQIIYYIVPTIIVLLVGWLSGTYSTVIKIVRYMGQDITNTTVSASTGFAAIPQEHLAALITGLAITVIVALILYIIFGLLLEIAVCRLAKYDDIGDAVNIKEVIADIQKITLGRYLGWYIILFIIALVFGFVLGVIIAIPYIGILIAFLILVPYISLVRIRSLGLIYSEVE